MLLWPSHIKYAAIIKIMLIINRQENYAGIMLAEILIMIIYIYKLIINSSKCSLIKQSHFDKYLNRAFIFDSQRCICLKMVPLRIILTNKIVHLNFYHIEHIFDIKLDLYNL